MSKPVHAGDQSRMGARGEDRRDSGGAMSSESLTVVLEHVQAALRGLKYGNVTLIVQDGRVVQVDRFEKTRIQET